MLKFNAATLSLNRVKVLLSAGQINVVHVKMFFVSFLSLSFFVCYLMFQLDCTLLVWHLLCLIWISCCCPVPLYVWYTWSMFHLHANLHVFQASFSFCVYVTFSAFAGFCCRTAGWRWFFFRYRVKSFAQPWGVTAIYVLKTASSTEHSNPITTVAVCNAYLGLRPLCFGAAVLSSP